MCKQFHESMLTWRLSQSGINTMDAKLLEILVCPLCKGELLFDKKKDELICKVDKIAYPIRDDIPVMLPDEARKIAS